MAVSTCEATVLLLLSLMTDPSITLFSFVLRMDFLLFSAGCLIESCLIKYGFLPIGPQDIRSSKVRMAEICSRQIGAAELRIPQIRAAHVCVLEIGTTQIGIPQIGMTEVSPSQICLLQISLRQINCVEINPTELPLAEIHSVQIWLECLNIGIRLSPGVPEGVP